MWSMQFRSWQRQRKYRDTEKDDFVFGRDVMQFKHLPVKIRKRRHNFSITGARKPQFVKEDFGERMLGEVQGKKASEGEETLANALNRAGMQYVFRYVFGSPRYSPGWKELDFIVFSDLVYLIEVDTAFTHAGKEQKDKLHDAMALQDPGIKRMGQLYHEVVHVDGLSTLSNPKLADEFVRRFT